MDNIEIYEAPQVVSNKVHNFISQLDTDKLSQLSQIIVSLKNDLIGPDMKEVKYQMEMQKEINTMNLEVEKIKTEKEKFCILVEKIYEERKDVYKDLLGMLDKSLNNDISVEKMNLIAHLILAQIKENPLKDIGFTGNNDDDCKILRKTGYRLEF